MDRLTMEIAASLRERKTLVVWLFDESLSVHKRREEIADRFDNVYRQLGLMDVDSKTALKTAVASFGRDYHLLSKEPTTDVEELSKQVRDIQPDKSKLTTIIHQSNIDFLTFSTWEKFVSYTNKEGLAYAQQASNDGTKPKEKLREAYARYAKTLITPAGSAEGNDISTGLKIELIALKNPMSLSKSDPMPIQLLFDGKPLSGANLKVFVGIDTEVAHRIITDAQGKANVPAEGAGPYLLNAIHMTEPQSEEAKSKNAHWESFWASLTFKRAQ
jgi:uncharacterized GH25 family protein